MINKTFFQILGLWLFAIACLSVMDTIIFHQSNMIFQGDYFSYPFIYKGFMGDAWHTAKLFCLYAMFGSVLIAWNSEKKMTIAQALFYMFVFACLTALTHWVMFHNLLIK